MASDEATTTKNPCLTPFTHRGIVFQNRCGLSPLTRGRASEEGVVNEMHEKYYTQRSSGGFLMTEATGISQHGLGWFKAPGIWSPEQVEAWKKVTTAVHEKGRGGKFSASSGTWDVKDIPILWE